MELFFSKNIPKDIQNSILRNTSLHSITIGNLYKPSSVLLMAEDPWWEEAVESKKVLKVSRIE